MSTPLDSCIQKGSFPNLNRAPKYNALTVDDLQMLEQVKWLALPAISAIATLHRQPGNEDWVGVEFTTPEARQKFRTDYLEQALPKCVRCKNGFPNMITISWFGSHLGYGLNDIIDDLKAIKPSHQPQPKVPEPPAAVIHFSPGGPVILEQAAASLKLVEAPAAAIQVAQPPAMRRNHHLEAIELSSIYGSSALSVSLLFDTDENRIAFQREYDDQYFSGHFAIGENDGFHRPIMNIYWKNMFRKENKTEDVLNTLREIFGEEEVRAKLLPLHKNFYAKELPAWITK